MIYLILLGAGIGFLYDFLKAIRKKTNNNVFLCILCDFIFWILSIFVSFYVLYKHYSFNLRLYHFLLIATGISVYITFFSDFFTFVVTKILNIFEFFLKLVFTISAFCGRIIKTCFFVLTFPLRWVFRKIKKFGVFKKIVSFIKFLKSKLLKQIHIVKRL